MSNETITVSVVITDLDTTNVTSVAECPEHLWAQWSREDIAQWAIDRDDAAFGRKAVLDESVETDHFGSLGWSYTEYYRAGGRYQVALTVQFERGAFTVTFPSGGKDVYLNEDMAAIAAGTQDGSVLGITTVIQ